ncbi:amino acid permease [Deinococcus koreensis]|uniref:Amino acid permease n=2 Tax=Deinococcus koreensis TaxID=2054903 RepID=A0A2K3V2L9_9DEIO|nr:amino acid permease [Deinococcus koreensis]
MGYQQELSRRMKGFSNFAISFSIICILSGGINSLGQGISSIGGASIGIGWPIGCLVSLLFALGMAQIASAYPTAGGLYHWGSVLGGRGWGWLTAWLNLIGLVTVLGAINVGTYFFFIGAFGETLGIPATFGTQAVFVITITAIQALVNHFGIRLTTRLTDMSGYLIFAVTLVLTVSLLVFARNIDLSRLWTFTNFSGEAGGGVWPQNSSLLSLFLLCLLLPIYTITGFDASAHTAEETVDAQRVVPRGIVSSVAWSSLFGWIMLIAFVLAIPDMRQAAAGGFGVFFNTMNAVLPAGLKMLLYVGIFLAQFLCGLATVTSVSRMTFAFARDGGLPFSGALRAIHANYRTPVAAIWTTAIISVLFTLYTPAYTTIVSVTVIFLFLSYGIPIVLGLFAYGRSWTNMGPWNLGPLFRVVAALVGVAVVMIFVIGIQPPNAKALPITLIFLGLTAVVWFGLERRRFLGPPNTEAIRARQAELDAVRPAGTD